MSELEESASRGEAQGGNGQRGDEADDLGIAGAVAVSRRDSTQLQNKRYPNGSIKKRGYHATRDADQRISLGFLPGSMDLCGKKQLRTGEFDGRGSSRATQQNVPYRASSAASA